MEHALCSRAGANGPTPLLSPLPPLGLSRPERLVGFVAPARPAEGTARGSHGHQRHSTLSSRPPLPDPALGSSRPKLAATVRVESADDDARRAGSASRNASPGAAGGDRRNGHRSTTRRSPWPLLRLPPPPPLGSSRPELAAVVRCVNDGDHGAPRRGSARRSGSPGAEGVRPQRRSTTRRSPSPPCPLPLPLPPPPPLGSSPRPELAAVVRHKSDDDARHGGSGKRRKDSPRKQGAEGGRRRERRSPPPRSPSPVPPKRSPRGSYRKECRRNEDSGKGNHTCSRSCSPDRPYSRYGATAIGQDKTGRLGLMTYKQFIQVLEDDVSSAQAGCRYQEYRTEYINSQKRAYFDLNKNEDWLKDMYHPTKLLSVIQRRNDFCKTVARNLIVDLRNGTLDLGPGVFADAAIKSGEGNDGSSEDNADYGEKKRKHARGPQKEIKPLSAAPKAHPISSQHQRIHTDIHRTLALVKKLDSEKDIMEDILLTGDHGKSNVRSVAPAVIIRGLNTVKGLEGVELLDTLLTYLWRVHGVDCYGMCEMKHAKGFRHVRAENKSDRMAENISAADWEKKLDSFWEERLMNGQDPLVVLTAMDKTEAALIEVLECYVRKTQDEKCVWKYGCGAKGCEKLFHAPEYVHKHLNLKHPDLVSTLASKVKNDIYFQNYMNDPDAPGPGGKSIMQKTDRMRRRLDEQMFDASGVSGSPAQLHPMCAPVPGAGPYGPVVPAPPAMQMIQKRLPGPDSAQHRKPSVLGQMLPMYPSFPLDSRIYRRKEVNLGSNKDIGVDHTTPIQFFIKPWSEPCMSVQLDLAKVTVNNLIELACKKHKISAAAIDAYAVLEGRDLHDNDAYLSSYAVCRDSTVEIRQRLSGGAVVANFDTHFNLPEADLFHIVQIPDAFRKLPPLGDPQITSVKYFARRIACSLHDILKYVTGRHRAGFSLNGQFTTTDIVWVAGRVFVQRRVEMKVERNGVMVNERVRLDDVPFTEEAGLADYFQLSVIFGLKFNQFGLPCHFVYLLQDLAWFPHPNLMRTEAVIAYIVNHPSLQPFEDLFKQMTCLATTLQHLTPPELHIFYQRVGSIPANWINENVNGVPDMVRVYSHNLQVVGGLIYPNWRYQSNMKGCIYFCNNYLKHADKTIQAPLEAVVAAYSLHFHSIISKLFCQLACNLHNEDWVTSLLCNRLADKRERERAD